MEETDARKQKAYAAEKQMSVVRAIVIVFGTLTYFLQTDPRVRNELAVWLMPVIWTYGGFVLLYRPWEKHPVFLASWFSYSSDALFTTLWVYATGGFHSPYYVIYYTSIIAVAYRFGLRTTLFTSTLYTLCYVLLVLLTGQMPGNLSLLLVRAGFLFITGFMAYLITKETLWQTRQKLQLASLIEETKKNQTELLALNEQLRVSNDLFNHAEQNAALGSYFYHFATEKLEYSDNLYRLLGHAPGNFKPTIDSYLEFVHPDDRREMRQLISDAMKSYSVPGMVTHRVITRSGSLRYLRATGMVNEHGGEKVLIGTLQDVTNDIQLNEALREKNTQLEQINNELSSFNYVASHDLQEPVRKILTFSELVREREARGLSESGNSYLQRITAAARRMQHLIEAFLSYSHISNAELRFEKLDLNEVMAEVNGTFAERLEEKKGQLTWQNLPTVRGVRIQIQQMFINLVGNAIKYSKEGVPPQISVTASEVQGLKADPPGGSERWQYWKISVRDNGIGFEPEFNDKIFDVFVRLHSKDRYEGTGIGLAICKKIAATHKGFIRAEGTPGEGAVFHIYLPIIG